MSKLIAQPYVSAVVLQVAVATLAVNQVTLLATVLLLASRPQARLCVVVVVLVVAVLVAATEAFGVGLQARIVQQPATSAVDRIIMLATAKPRP
jgi:hypothetical protein